MFAKPGRVLYVPLVIVALVLTFVPIYPASTLYLYPTVPLWALLGVLLFFLRDPERPLVDGSGIASPADGQVARIIETDEKVSILIELHVSNVHVQRTPFTGKILSVENVAGGYQRVYFIRKKLSGDSEAIQKNARTVIEMETNNQERARIELIAGALARRCIPYVKPEQDVVAGQRIGMILFGSLVRFEIFSTDYVPTVKVGDKVYGNKTLILAKRE
jgi:phosphatidylserine decarboxylase